MFSSRFGKLFQMFFTPKTASHSTTCLRNSDFFTCFLQKQFKNLEFLKRFKLNHNLNFNRFQFQGFKAKKSPPLHAKYFIFSAVGTYMYDSNTDRIALAIIEQFLNEVELIEKLLTDSNSCKKCKSRVPRPIRRRHHRNHSENDENDESAECSCSSKVAEIFSEKDESWEPYLKREKENIIIWRKEHIPAMYAYKVYAKYDDITPNDFLHVQTDLEYRKQWDDTVAELEMIETDHFNDTSIIYWEIRWPRLFANRDYVYDRKIYTDEKKKWIVISNKSSQHEKCPEYPSKHRVKDYWSYMIIKPKTTFYEPGLQYILIYYDDPGLAIPSTVTSWVAQTQMPDFLYKLYIATKKFAEKKQKSMK